MRSISAYLGAPGVIRQYMALPPAQFQGSIADVGTPVVLSFKAPPADIIAGKDDARLRSFFNSIPKNLMVWWSYWHEPEDNIENGEFTAGQYRAAWEHLESLLPRRDTLRPTLILMRWDLHVPDSRPLSDYLTPGLKVLAWDAYVGGGGDQTAADALGPAAATSKRLGLGFGIAETSVCTTADFCGEQHGLPAPDWATAVQGLVSQARAHQAEFVTWFETIKDADWRLGAHSTAAADWKRLTH